MTSINPVNVGSQFPLGGRSPGDNRMDKAMGGVADLLDMSTDELKAAQKSGISLEKLAADKGVSKEKLTTTLAQGLKENAPVNAPSEIDFTQMASDIIEGKRPSGPPPGMRGRLESSESNESAGQLSQLLSNYGIDGKQLMSLLNASNSSTESDETENSFVSELKSLINQYGSKGLSYDVKG